MGINISELSKHTHSGFLVTSASHPRGITRSGLIFMLLSQFRKSSITRESTFRILNPWCDTILKSQFFHETFFFLDLESEGWCNFSCHFPEMVEWVLPCICSPFFEGSGFIKKKKKGVNTKFLPCTHLSLNLLSYSWIKTEMLYIKTIWKKSYKSVIKANQPNVKKKKDKIQWALEQHRG